MRATIGGGWTSPGTVRLNIFLSTVPVGGRTLAPTAGIMREGTGCVSPKVYHKLHQQQNGNTVRTLIRQTVALEELVSISNLDFTENFKVLGN